MSLPVNLDTANTESLLDLMEKLNEEEGRTFVFSTHDARVMKRSKRIIKLQDGKGLMMKLIASLALLLFSFHANAMDFENTVLLRGVLQESYGPTEESSDSEFSFYYNATFRDIAELSY